MSFRRPAPASRRRDVTPRSESTRGSVTTPEVPLHATPGRRASPNMLSGSRVRSPRHRRPAANRYRTTPAARPEDRRRSARHPTENPEVAPRFGVTPVPRVKVPSRPERSPHSPGTPAPPGPIAQRESARLTRERSLVRNQLGPQFGTNSALDQGLCCLSAMRPALSECHISPGQRRFSCSSWPPEVCFRSRSVLIKSEGTLQYRGRKPCSSQVRSQPVIMG